MTQSKHDDKNPVIQLDLQTLELYELAQDKEVEAMKATETGDILFRNGAYDHGWAAGFAAAIIHTLDWLRGEAPYPFDGTDGSELEESPSRSDLRPSATELLNSADIPFPQGWLAHQLGRDTE